MKKCKPRAGSCQTLRWAESQSPREMIRHALRGQLHQAMRELVHDLFEQEVDSPMRASLPAR